MFHFRAKFRTEEEARIALPSFAEYLRQQGEAYEYWQDNRKGGNEMLKKLRQDYPLAFKFTDVDHVGPYSNELSGNLISSKSKPRLNGRYVEYVELVWHFDNWDHLSEFAKSLVGCFAADYYSDEYQETRDMDY